MPVKSSEVLRLAAELCQKGEKSPIIAAFTQLKALFGGEKVSGYASKCGYYIARDARDITGMVSSLVDAARQAKDAGD